MSDTPPNPSCFDNQQSPAMPHGSGAKHSGADAAQSLEPVQSLWVGSPWSAVERLCAASFLANGHPFHLYAYEEIGNVPPGVELYDAREILPEDKIFCHQAGAEGGSLAGFSDLFRWNLLVKKGGWWVDMDMVCLRPLNFSVDIVFGDEKKGQTGVSILRFPAGHALLHDMAMRCAHPYSPSSWSSPAERWRLFWRRIRKGNQHSSTKFGGAGPKLFQQAVEFHSLFHYIQQPQVFYPVYPREWRNVFDGTLEGGMARLKQAYTLHLWNEKMRRKKFDKNTSYAVDSIFEQLRSKFDPVR